MESEMMNLVQNVIATVGDPNAMLITGVGLSMARVGFKAGMEICKNCESKDPGKSAAVVVGCTLGCGAIGVGISYFGLKLAQRLQDA